MAEQDLPFARDFGYLDKFLTNLGTHADGLPEPQRSELKRLVSAEVSQWERIKALLRGEMPIAPTSKPAAPATSAPVAPAAAPMAEAKRGLTVGSLMPRP